MTGVIDIFADDLRWDDWRYMPNLRRLMKRGTYFAALRQPAPMCTPARAALYRGQAGNGPNATGVLSQATPWTTELRQNQLPQWLAAEAVECSILGKFMTPINPPQFSDGWSWMRTTRSPNATSAFGYHLWDGTDTIGPYDEEHQDNYFARVGLDRIVTHAAEHDNWWMHYPSNSPHGPLQPTPRNGGRWAGIRHPLPASALSVDSSMPSWLRARPTPTPAEVSSMRSTHRQRIRECVDLDDWIGMVVAWLDATGMSATTHILVWSDNGNGLLEHRAVLNGKGAPYEWSALTPLLAVGPDWPQDLTVDVPCFGPDVTATIAGIFDAQATIPQDGTDLRLIADDPDGHNDRATFGGLDDQFSSVPNRPACDYITTATHKLVRYHEPDGGWVDTSTDPYELFDLDADPSEMTNLAPTETALRDELEDRLDGLLAGG